MKVTVDTNVLVRGVVQDDAQQARAAAEVLGKAELIAVSSACLCEFVWVLRRTYGFERQQIAAAIQALVASANVRVDRPTVAAGLAALAAGADFADGVIAYLGRWLGGTTFVSFDKSAVTKIAAQGHDAELLAGRR